MAILRICPTANRQQDLEVSIGFKSQFLPIREPDEHTDELASASRAGRDVSDDCMHDFEKRPTSPVSNSHTSCSLDRSKNHRGSVSSATVSQRRLIPTMDCDRHTSSSAQLSVRKTSPVFADTPANAYKMCVSWLGSMSVGSVQISHDRSNDRLTRTKVGTIYTPGDGRSVRALREVVERRYQFVKYAAWMYEVELRSCVLLDERPVGVSMDAA